MEMIMLHVHSQPAMLVLQHATTAACFACCNCTLLSADCWLRLADASALT